MRLPALPLVLLFVVGCNACSKQVPHTGPNRGTEIAISVYETSSETWGKPVQFRLTPDELARVHPHLPDVADADDYLCKCGVPSFAFELYERGATEHFAQGHFFHGPDELVVTFDAGGGGRLRGTKRFHDALVAVIQARGYLK